MKYIISETNYQSSFGCLEFWFEHHLDSFEYHVFGWPIQVGTFLSNLKKIFRYMQNTNIQVTLCSVSFCFSR